MSQLSESATFVTASSVEHASSTETKFIALASQSTFTYFRKVASIPKEISAATLHVTALNQDPLLSAYRLWIDSELISIGPGRGEARVWNGDGTFRSMPYFTHDVTSYLQNKTNIVIAMETMNANPSPKAWLELNMFFVDGSSQVVSTDETWSAFNGDKHRNPKPSSRPSAGNAFLENIDATYEPVGWKTSNFVLTSEWSNATATIPTESDLQSFTAKMQPDLSVIETMKPRNVLSRNDTFAVIDFGKEFQGGLRLRASNITEVIEISIKCGESYDSSTDTVGTTWGWEFTWTLRQDTSSQVLEQHKYMECRFVSLSTKTFSLPENLQLEAWVVRYPYVTTDSYFRSDNETLNKVWELARYTLEATSLDTYTDSNTRERRPYEADGIIAATSRLLVQRDVLWPRHSHAWVLQYPTWPVEWKLLSAFLGFQDYWNTGRTDLMKSFFDIMVNRTFIGFLNESVGVLNTEGMGRHIVDWMPDGSESDETVQRHEFTASNHMSVTNFLRTWFEHDQRSGSEQ